MGTLRAGTSWPVAGHAGALRISRVKLTGQAFFVCRCSQCGARTVACLRGHFQIAGRRHAFRRGSFVAREAKLQCPTCRIALSDDTANLRMEGE